MNIAVFYHAKISGEGIPNAEEAARIVAEQMQALDASGLAQQAQFVGLGLDGGDGDALLLLSLCPYPSPELRLSSGHGEQPTLAWAREWSSAHPGWAVCYHHSKGVANQSEVNQRWRHCMQRAVIEGWRTGYYSVRGPCHTAGAHWFRNRNQKYWAGNFWWARSDYLAALPPIPEATHCGRSYEGEVWIGKGNPVIHDLAPHRPMVECRD